MQESLLQLFVTYLFFAAIVSAVFWLIRRITKNKMMSLVYILVLLSPLFLYIPVEINTYLYGKDFKNIEINTGFNLPVIYYKVFSINDKEAELFCVEGENGNHDIGTFYYFVKENGNWTFHESGQTIWTNLGGSASEYTVPPYF